METTPISTVQADDCEAVRTVLREIGSRLGFDARLVLGEFITNAAEHCRNHRVDLLFQEDKLVVMDYGGGIKSRRTHKSQGEGGYGLLLIESLGGVITRWRKGTRLEFHLTKESFASQ